MYFVSALSDVDKYTAMVLIGFGLEDQNFHVVSQDPTPIVDTPGLLSRAEKRHQSTTSVLRYLQSQSEGIAISNKYSRPNH